jgi:hypothetical protein
LTRFADASSSNATAMAPGAKVLEAELGKAADQLWHGDRDNLTVNNVRASVAKKLKLESDFFVHGEWKQRSKEVIKKRVVSLALPA